MRWEDVDLDRGTVLVLPKSVHKRDGGIPVFLGPRTLESLRRYANARGLSRIYVPGSRQKKRPKPVRGFAAAMHAAGIGGEMTRQGFWSIMKTIAYDNGAPSESTQCALGHKGTENAITQDVFQAALRKFAAWYEDYLLALVAKQDGCVAFGARKKPQRHWGFCSYKLFASCALCVFLWPVFLRSPTEKPKMLNLSVQRIRAGYRRFIWFLTALIAAGASSTPQRFASSKYCKALPKSISQPSPLAYIAPSS